MKEAKEAMDVDASYYDAHINFTVTPFFYLKGFMTDRFSRSLSGSWLKNNGWTA